MLDSAQCVADRLAAEVSAEKAAREQVEQACGRLGMQLLDLQRQLRASEMREAAATQALDDSTEQVRVQEGSTSGRNLCVSCVKGFRIQ